MQIVLLLSNIWKFSQTFPVVSGKKEREMFLEGVFWGLVLSIPIWVIIILIVF
jgi:hypothetical protein